LNATAKIPANDIWSPTYKPVVPLPKRQHPSASDGFTAEAHPDEDLLREQWLALRKGEKAGASDGVRGSGGQDHNYRFETKAKAMKQAPATVFRLAVE
jgi:hypothetical protein